MNENKPDYTYLSFDENFNKNSNDVLAKAVRVTKMVKDKLKKGFEKNFTVAGIEQKQVETINSHLNEVKNNPVVTATEEDSTEDASGGRNYLVSEAVIETEENLIALANKLEALEKQKRVVATIKRMALYTKELLEKVKRVTKKWFSFISKAVPTESPKEEKVEAVAAAETQPEVIPYDWWQEKQEEPQVPTVEPVEEPIMAIKQEEKVAEPVIEPSVETTPVIETPAEPEISNFGFEIPNFAQTEETKEESVMEKPKFELPSFNYEKPEEEKKMDFGFTANEFMARNEEEYRPTGNTIMAKLHKVGNEIQQLNGVIAKLKEELRVANTTISSTNDAVDAYKKVNKDLSDRISTLINQVKSLSEEREKLKKILSEIIKKSEENVKQLKEEYEIKLKNVKEEKESIIAEYERKLSDQNQKSAAEIAKINAEYKSSMQMIYDGMQNISETAKVAPKVSKFPEPEKEETYDYERSYAKVA